MAIEYRIYANVYKVTLDEHGYEKEREVMMDMKEVMVGQFGSPNGAYAYLQNTKVVRGG
ncbi:MAG: hypothetical protein ACXAEN_23825 [Candidatus Thorarchaeota archaeon]